ncbi:threonine dehydratase [Desulfotomaculum arcticum]|uniref:L-threonine dehydratase catabolic TdcB n=2 Tax=Desulfotruncus TaxID=2867377 RepID=A0A1I2WFQ5_9FIRM|nr:threonine dehydratase [Desulfotomaculum arcticum] [Desulfotruncus arcticus DSM 17038]
MSLTIAEIKEAAGVLKGVIYTTPVDYSRTFSGLTGSNVYFKTENVQKTGSFKIRGAYYKISRLAKEQWDKGVITASAGNHGQGVAYAAAKAGINATVVMPANAPIAKVEATRDYGAVTVLAGKGYDDAYARAMELQNQTGAIFVHGFDDPDIIAGQGTVGLEILEQLPETDAIVVPVGGGGLIAGVALAVKSLRPEVKIIGVQSEAAPAMFLSHQSKCWQEMHGQVCTLADGIAVRRPGRLNFDLLCRYVDEMVTVEDEEIARAITMLLERSKMVVEGAGAVGLAALLQQRIVMPGKNVVVVLSGGNIDINAVSILIERGLLRSGRRVYLRAIVDDRPGTLQNLLEAIADLQANIISVSHDRVDPRVPLKKAEVKLLLETRNDLHIMEITNLLKEKGYKIISEKNF